MRSTLVHAPKRAHFETVHRDDHQVEPRTHGITKVRSPYYAAMGKMALQDVATAVSEWMDTLKLVGTSFTLAASSRFRLMRDSASTFRRGSGQGPHDAPAPSDSSESASRSRTRNSAPR